MDAELHKQARARDLNVSAAAEAGIADALAEPAYYFVNTNRDRIPVDGVDGTRVYDHGVAATFGRGKFGKKLARIEPGDIVLSYVNRVGVRAVGRCLAPWDGYGVIGSDEELPRDERVETTRAETPKEEGDDPVEILDGTRLFSEEKDSPEYYLPVRWRAVLDVENAVSPQQLRTIGYPKRSHTVTDFTVGDDELIADIVAARAARAARGASV
jgi:hypothetical protein